MRNTPSPKGDVGFVDPDRVNWSFQLTTGCRDFHEGLAAVAVLTAQ